MNTLSTAASTKSIAVVYLARGVETDHLERFRRFARSYRQVSAGVDHCFFVIFKGFDSNEQLRAAKEVFSEFDYVPLFTGDDSFDIGAYADVVNQIPQSRVCFLNTNSEILSENWLAKLSINLDRPRIGLVGATGSFESLVSLHPSFPPFPNVHIRSHAFMMNCDHARKILPTFSIRSKQDAFFSESGPAGLTRRIFSMGLSALIVGSNGRGYPPEWWPVSGTFRQNLQDNLLVHDNVTRTFEAAPWQEKRNMSFRTWGQYVSTESMALLPQRYWKTSPSA
jgi:hypothetical protein